VIELSSEGAVVAVGLVVVAAIGWAANLSVRSALEGPGWALAHLRVSTRYFMLVLIAGAVLLVVVSPVWVGLAVTYVAFMVWFLAGLLRRSLTRTEDAQGFDELPMERRLEIVSKSRRLIVVTAVGIVLIGLASLPASQAAGAVGVALGVVLGLTAWRLG